MKRINCLFVALGAWRRKGLPIILKAMETLRQNEKFFSCLRILGNPGKGEYSIIKPYKVLINEDRLKLLGYRSDVRSVYLRSDILLVASYYEAMSLVMLEALHFGMPIISTHVNGTEEIVIQGVNGFIVKHDYLDMVKYIETLATHPELVKKMGRESKKLSYQFMPERVAKKTEHQYLLILKSKM